MGVYKQFNKTTGKWELRGFQLLWEFDTEAEADNAKGRAWKQHNANLETFRLISNMLAVFR